ncbi:MAG: type II secretion system F family protein [Ornithinimicrobium sp.]|uniref:type II secretion system F family protein n=1 Tax=Ornithinimicrobium sp. TaxID=1977084 RepID=UPI0026E10BC1|nr:type II secretion system F family protein [Ornithinimicrobium sp.]MDO5740670.1 type II secretion system F family protein [Ornithinimicrobium sp.]
MTRTAILVLPLVLAVLAVLSVLLWPSRAADRPVIHDAATGPARGQGVTPLADRLASIRRLRSRGPERQEVMLLDGVAAALEAGLPTEQALAVVLDAQSRSAGESSAWAELRRAAREGQALAPAWARLARRTASPTVMSVSRAWAVASATGAPLAAAARSSAQAARERHRLQRAIQIATAGARATALVLSLLPIAGVGLAAIVGIGPAALYASPVALASAGVGLGLLVVGHLLVGRLVAGVVRGVR